MDVTGESRQGRKERSHGEHQKEHQEERHDRLTRHGLYRAIKKTERAGQKSRHRKPPKKNDGDGESPIPICAGSEVRSAFDRTKDTDRGGNQTTNHESGQNGIGTDHVPDGADQSGHGLALLKNGAHTGSSLLKSLLLSLKFCGGGAKIRTWFCRLRPCRAAVTLPRNIETGKTCNHPAVYGLAPRVFLM